jgi:hypothetical protein
MADIDLKAAFSGAPEPVNAGFAETMARRIAVRRRRRMALLVVMGLAAALCFAGLFVGIGEMASLGGAADTVALDAGILDDIAPLLVFLAAALVLSPLVRAQE